jgi:dihydroorotate dehydrogenase electron transfer subunit
MLRAWGVYPVLSRPISVFDADAGKTSFLYRTVGQGTGMFARLKPGDALGLVGPQGRGFPGVPGKTALVGGGAGIAPLYLAARRIKNADVFLGFRDAPFLVQAYEAAADRVVVNSGGFITDDIDPTQYDAILACGPEIMMKTLYEKCKKTGAAAKVYVSLESRMACGVGACFVCSRPVGGGNKKICKDGPVFPAEEVFGL